MKKTKILTVLGVLLALGITACGGNKGSKSEEKSSQSQQSSVAPASSSAPASTPDTSAPEQDSSSSSAVAHVHVFNEEDAEISKAPTCTETGTKIYYCECGETKTETIKKLGHDFGEWVVTPATCTQDGSRTRACKREGCDATETEVIKAAHDWDTAQEVAAGTDPANQVGYTLATCKVCHAIKAEILARDAKFYKGGIKSGTPSSSFKLNAKNDKAYWRFTVAGTKMYKGMLYQYAAMDQWSGNTERSYAQTSTSGDHAPTYPLGNFDAMVNGDRVDKSQWIDVQYSELLKDGDDSSEMMGDNYSPVALAPMGECVIQPGTNEITYERLGSYNLIINKLVFIGSEYEHVHAAAATYSSNEEGHWHACTALGCPTGKADALAAHTFGDKYDEVAATCSAEGSYKQKCSVCDYVKTTKTDKIAHTYTADYVQTKAPKCDEEGSKERECSVCHQKDVQPIPALGHELTGGIAAVNAAGENGAYVATTAYNCVREGCNKSAIQWSALDYDPTLSTAASDEGKVPTLRDNDKAIRLDTSTTQGMGDDHSKKGCHVIYKVNVPANVTNAGLAMYATQPNYSNDVFDQQTNENSRGYRQNEQGEWVIPDSRYGIKVDGTEYVVAKNNGAIKAAGTAWYPFPGISLTLTAGVHQFEFFKYGGYDIDNYAFMLSGLPHVEPTHTHVLSEWQTDDNNHWKTCSDEGCLDAAGTKLYNGAHDWELNITTPATCTTAGVGTKTCSVCGKTVDASSPALGHNFGEWQVISEATVDAAGSRKRVCSVCSAEETEVIPQLPLKEWVKGELTAAIPNAASLTSTTYADSVVGYKWNSADNAVATFTYTPAAAGTYTLKLLLSPKSGNQAKTGFWKQDSDAKTSITVNGVALVAPETDLDFTVCTVSSATGRDGRSTMMEPVWFEIANITLTAEENTIVVSYLTGGYSYFLCGAAIYK